MSSGGEGLEHRIYFGILVCLLAGLCGCKKENAAEMVQRRMNSNEKAAFDFSGGLHGVIGRMF